MFASRMPSRCAVSDETFRSSSTPTTVSHSLPTLIGWPIGSSVVKKRDFTPWPMIVHRRDAAESADALNWRLRRARGS